MMQKTRISTPDDIIEAIFNEIEASARDERVDRLWRFASGKLAQGLPRRVLLDSFEVVRSSLEDEDRDAQEDSVVRIMDSLTGYCSPSARL